jgi:TonB family protein
MQLAGGPGPHDPLVSVALRSDGSVDDVTIVRSSGRADLDEAVRRIVRLNARYAAFPANVAASLRRDRHPPHLAVCRELEVAGRSALTPHDVAVWNEAWRRDGELSAPDLPEPAV